MNTMHTFPMVLPLSPQSRRSWEQGLANGKAEYILETLTDHGKVPLGIQEQILHQTSFFQLDRWFLLARQVRSVEEFVNRM